MKITKSRSMINIVLLAANFLSFLFLLYYALIPHDSVMVNTCMFLWLAVLATDLIYAATANNWLGFWLIPAEIALLLLCFFPRQAASVDITNLSGTSIITLCAAVTMPLVPALFSALELLGVGRDWKDPKFLRLLKRLAAPALLVGLFVLALIGYDHANNYGWSLHEFTTSRADFLLLGLIFMIACMLLRMFCDARQGSWNEYLQRSAAVLIVGAVLAGYGAFSFLRGYITFKDDTAAAEVDYAAMFGESSRDYKGDVHQVPLSMTALLFCIRNGTDYQAVQDVVYCTLPEEEGKFAGMRLAYDMYLPTSPLAHRAVVVMLHGSGQDKSSVDNPQRSRYLASKGYTVFELQVGDRAEKDTGFPKGAEPDWDLMLRSIDRFFAYATANESDNADFDSVFLMGSSMGGFLTTDYIYQFEHHYQEYGVTIRGIAPLYGVTAEAEIDKNSLPVLIYTGDHDGYVNVWDIRELREKYRMAGNKNAITLTVSYGGHSCDIELSSRGGQIELYYLERFFGKLR